MAEPNPALNDWQNDAVIRLTVALGVTRQYKLRKYLGGGATSTVWLASELDPDASAPKRDRVALKVLKPESEHLWRNAFEDEISVLRQLYQAEEDLRDGVHAIPQVYDVSQREMSPAFLAMEFVPFPSVDTLALPPHDLPNRLTQVNELYEAFRSKLEYVLDDARVMWEKDQASVQLVSNLQKRDEEIRRGVDGLQGHLINQLAANQGLSEEEVILVGQQVCRVLQLLHEKGRGYQDFQLLNVRYDRANRRIKIIDWNVVTPKDRVNLENQQGLEHVQQDLFKLAQYLFWLRTLVMPPASGAPARSLARLGGHAWSGNTSLALRLVLERALDPDPTRRFQRAVSRSTPVGQPLAEIDSLGLALTTVHQWFEKKKVAELLAEIERHKSQARPMDALALVDLAQRRLPLEAANIQGIYGPEIERYFDELSKQTRRPEFEEGQRRLDLVDAAGAERRFAAACLAYPDDLEAARWQVLAQYLQPLKMDDCRRLWASGKLQAGMQALTEERWSAAKAALSDATLPLALPALVCDAEIGAHLAAAEAAWNTLQQPVANLDVAEAAAQRLLQALAAADQRQKDSDRPPYLSLPLQRWPVREAWRTQARNIAVNPQDIEDLNGLFNTDFEQAMQRFEKLLQEHPANIELVRLAREKVQQYVKAGQVEKAIGLFDAVQRLIGARFEISELRQWCDGAQAWLDMIASLNPRTPAVGRPS